MRSWDLTMKEELDYRLEAANLLEVSWFECVGIDITMEVARKGSMEYGRVRERDVMRRTKILLSC